MTSNEIRKRFLDFFAKRGHAILPSASLVPENDPSVLFNTAGMQPLVPYLMGQKHPLGTRLASCQKCVRTGDLEDIGDNRHFSFFEMLGNWSLGDYFKEDAIKWSYEFLTSPDEGLGLDPARLAVTIFAGDEHAPFDQESKDIWMGLGIPEHRIYPLGADDNWWSPGDNGPCGPCSEMFYDMNGDFIGQEISQESFVEQVKKETFIEIWNDVFMEYEKKDGAVVGKLSQKNVDTGAGLERITAVMQGKNTAYDTDLLSDITGYIDANLKGNSNIKSVRIITDHVRTATMMIADGVRPGSKDRGYILRRLMRRAIVQADKIELSHSILVGLRSSFASKYEDIYENLKNESEKQHEIFTGEIEKFIKTIHSGLKEFEKAEPLLYDSNVSLDTIPMDWNPEKYISGETAFNLFQTFGFPLELTIELAQERGWVVDVITFKKLLGEHQAKSSAGAEQKFKGGLANTNETTVRLHTAHHLLLAALQEIVDKNIHQRGSNITEERLRMDFSFDRKVTPDELQQVESLVNSWIEAKLPVVRCEMQLAEAEKLGAEMEFGAKYPDIVSVYTIQNTNDEYVSKEFCGGPHVTNTSEIGSFKIQKEEASSAGVRRIKAVIK